MANDMNENLHGEEMIMLKREEGFILPLVMILSLLLSSLVIHQIELLETDRLFFQERKNYFHHGLLLQSASNEMLSQLKKSDTIEEHGQFSFGIGSATYHIVEINEQTATVQFETRTALAGGRKATVIYDVRTHTIIKWTE